MQMTLIEQESTDIRDHIKYWDAVRLENLLAYYARKEGLTHLGLQPLPALTVSEYKCKEAIKMKLLLESLRDSRYGNEPWTLPEVSAEIINTSPKNCFKKKAYTVTVYFDKNPNNSFPYICWDFIYYQDEQSEWQKVAGQVDINGLYFRESNGDITYFTLFQPDADRYGQTGHWSVTYKNHTLSTSVTSSSRIASDLENRPPTHPISSPKTPRKRRRQTDEDTTRESPTSTSTGLRLRRRGREQGESSTDGYPSRSTSRRRRPTVGSAVSPEEVGSGTRSVPRTGLTRNQRLQAEARDPPLILLQGCANSLKCFRYRCSHKHAHLYLAASTVFAWMYSSNEKSTEGRMLIAFSSNTQRDLFLKSVTIPKGCHYCYGSVDCL